MSLHCYKYHLPFVNPLQTSKQTFKYREGFILEYTTGDFQCYGEAAPLPGYSRETLADVQQTIVEIQDVISASLNSDQPVDRLQDLYNEKEIPPSLQFGLDSLAYQLQANNEDTTLPDFLFPKVVDSVPVNTLASLHSKSFFKNIRELVDKEFQTIKFKVGIDFNTELKNLKQIRNSFPDLIIRLDANNAWSVEEALRNIPKLESLDIGYCEEPLDEATPENFELLNQQTQVPLALDESVTHRSYWPNLLPFTSYLILKPTLLGSFSKNIKTRRLANTHNNKTVFTTALESGVGRRIIAILASGLGSSQTAHGLTTGKLLARDVHSDLAYISKGAYHLNRHHHPKIDFQTLGDVASSLF